MIRVHRIGLLLLFMIGLAWPAYPLPLSGTTCPGSGCVVRRLSSEGSVGVQVTGTFSGTLQFEQSISGTTWVAWSVTPNGTSAQVTSTTTAGYWVGTTAGAQYIRVRVSSYTSGTADVTTAVSITRSLSGVPWLVGGVLPFSQGGLGFATATTGDLFYASATNTPNTLADVAVNNVLLSGGIGVTPAYGKVTASHITVPSSGAFGYFTRTGTVLSSATAGDQLAPITLKGTSSVATVGVTNLLTADGTFTTNAGWTAGAGWTIGSGVATHATGNTAVLSGTSTATSITTVYEIRFTVAVTTPGDGFAVALGGRDSGNVFTTAGAKVLWINPTANSGTLAFTPGALGTFVGTIDDVVIYAITPSTPIQSLVGSDGTRVLVEVRTGGDLSGAAEINGTLVGVGAGKNLIPTGSGDEGMHNVFVGHRVGEVTTRGYNNTALGNTAFLSATSAFSNVAVGHDALRGMLTGGQNTALGQQALNTSVSGNRNTATGFQSHYLAVSGDDNLANGALALYSSVTGHGNTAMGARALLRALGSNNLGIGFHAGEYWTGSNKVYLDGLDRVNTAGDDAGALFVGVLHATPASQTARINAALTLPYTLGVTGVSTLTGGAVIQGVTVGLGANAVAANTALGQGALSSGTLSGASNTGAGYAALQVVTSGANNSGFGVGALSGTLKGGNNTAVGVSALGGNTTGVDQTAVGYQAGRYIADGATANTISTTSVYLGSGTRSAADGRMNEIAIGYAAIGAGVNKAVIGNASVTDVYFGSATAGSYIHGARYFIGASTAGCSGTPTAATYGISTTCTGPEASPDQLLAMIQALQAQAAELRALIVSLQTDLASLRAELGLLKARQ